MHFPLESSSRYVLSILDASYNPAINAILGLHLRKAMLLGAIFGLIGALVVMGIKNSQRLKQARDHSAKSDLLDDQMENKQA
jgi:hypothetical protein